METRQVTQIKIYKLILNPMRGNTEGAEMVAIAYDKNKLIDWYKGEMQEGGWKDYGESYFPPKGEMGGYENPNHCWHKTFKKGSVLEWYNPINLFDAEKMEGIGYGHGISEEWTIQEAIDNYFSRNYNGTILIQ